MGTPSSRAMVTIVFSVDVYLGLPAISLVFATSIGLFSSGPRIPAKQPLTAVFHTAGGGSPRLKPHMYLSKRGLVVWLVAWLMVLRQKVGVRPRHRARGPSCFSTLMQQSTGPLYCDWPFWICSRVLMTSNGVTTNTASRPPAMAPATKLRPEVKCPFLSRSMFLKYVAEPQRRQYLRAKWVEKGPTPFHNAPTPSVFRMFLPVAHMPWEVLESCMRVLQTSVGCSSMASMGPARRPPTSAAWLDSCCTGTFTAPSPASMVLAQSSPKRWRSGSKSSCTTAGLWMMWTYIRWYNRKKSSRVKWPFSLASDFLSSFSAFAVEQGMPSLNSPCTMSLMHTRPSPFTSKPSNTLFTKLECRA
mmetsp:Transcript_24258/g.38433  ORF Transcript_24258/g.38433 Transcript_24258/m.38433 type:complete len:359 (-) Transcript_24258:223-1299(-)